PRCPRGEFKMNGPWVPLWPVSASSHADSVDHLYIFLIVVAAFFTALIFTLIIVFAVRYSRTRHPVAEQIKSSIGLELFWTVVPFLITIVIFVGSSKVYRDGEIPPQGAENIFVVGKQWMWKIQHPEGRREINELHIPVDTAIKLTLT